MITNDERLQHRAPDNDHWVRLPGIDAERAWETVLSLARQWTEFRLTDFKLAVAERVPFGNAAVRAVGAQRLMRAKPWQLQQIRAEFIAHYLMTVGDIEKGAK